MSETTLPSILQHLRTDGNIGARRSQAASPFDDPAADVILRSSDDVDFRVFKVILAQASPFFHSMFTLPPPDSAEAASEKTPIVDMTEDHETLDIILRICYPIYTPSFELDKASRILHAAQKYEMEAVMQFAKSHIMTFAESHPTRIYALACSSGFAEEARAAAKTCLQISLLDLCAAQSEFDSASAQALSSLVRYHMQHQEAAHSFTQSWQWLANERYFWQENHGYGCGNPAPMSRKDRSTDQMSIPHQAWWFAYMDDLTASLQNRPGGLGVLISAENMMMVFSKSPSSNCQSCRTNVVADIERFVSALSAKIRQAQSEITLDTKHIISA